MKVFQVLCIPDEPVLNNACVCVCVCCSFLGFIPNEFNFWVPFPVCGRGVGARWSSRSLSTQTGLGFYTVQDSVSTGLVYFYLLLNQKWGICQDDPGRAERTFCATDYSLWNLLEKKWSGKLLEPRIHRKCTPTCICHLIWSHPQGNFTPQISSTGSFCACGSAPWGSAH